MEIISKVPFKGTVVDDVCGLRVDFHESVCYGEPHQRIRSAYLQGDKEMVGKAISGFCDVQEMHNAVMAAVQTYTL